MSETGGRRSHLVECYWPGVNEQQLNVTVGRARSAADELRRQGHDLRFVGSILVPADETVFLLFDGDEADVRAVSEQAGVAFERVLESVWIDGHACSPYPPGVHGNEGSTS